MPRWRLASLREVVIKDPIVLRVLTALPIIYVWILVPLSGVELHEPPPEGNPYKLGHRCEGWPRCHGTVLGVSIADMIATPDATGMFAFVFFWPMVHLWTLSHQIQGSDWLAKPLMMGCLACFGLFLAVPVTISPWFNYLAANSLCLCLFAFYQRLWNYCHPQRVVCVVLLACSLMVWLTLLWGSMLLLYTERLGGDAYALRDSWPYLGYVLQASGVTCAVLLAQFLHTEVFAEQVEQPAESTPKGHYTLILWSLGMLPVIYVWSLMPLASWKPGGGVTFARHCRLYPDCSPFGVGISVSDFICTPQATGAMAAVFFWPMVHMWSMMTRHCGEDNYSLRRLLGFYLCFGSFLSNPVIHRPCLHFVSVLLFSTFAMWHYVVLLGICKPEKLQCCVVLLILGCLAFLGVSAVIALSLFQSLTGGQPVPEKLFYFFEAAGLSVMCIFPWTWQFEEENAKLAYARMHP
mmetsp:Transcript_33004/g.77128  ORF Transcript_33004/g.77128 Transcript_33004/m.77128 type:complete len:464 (-) Transcript_33004:58-1449(-)